MASELECHLEGCQATIQAETEREALSRAERHVRQSHPELELDEAVETLRAGIVEI